MEKALQEMVLNTVQIITLSVVIFHNLKIYLQFINLMFWATSQEKVHSLIACCATVWVPNESPVIIWERSSKTEHSITSLLLRFGNHTGSVYKQIIIRALK